MKAFIALASLFCLSGVVFAEDVCAKSDKTTADMVQCSAVQYKAADRDLNQTYQRLTKALWNPETKKALVATQVRWIQFRDSECAFQRSLYEGGTMAAVAGGACLVNVTQERTKALKSMLDELNNH
jgi:uncharacterized protein YecT (DUF1311 family)